MKRILASLLFCAAGAHGADIPPYALDGTEVRAIQAHALQRNYELFVSLPTDYATTKRRYPVMFVTDANYAFPVIRSIAGLFGRHSKDIDKFILVGLSYGKGETPEYSRRRDYTPSLNPRSVVSDMPGREARFGESDAYRRFLVDEVFPFVAKTYRADMTHKIFVGHSYGGLLGVDILLAEPTTFEYYILGSPSLWFNRKLMFKREQAYAATHKDLPADVYFGIGGFETINLKSTNPRFASHGDDDMVRDLQAFTRALKSHHYPNLHLQTKVIDEEDHLTVFPALVTRGMRWALRPNPRGQ